MSKRELVRENASLKKELNQASRTIQKLLIKINKIESEPETIAALERDIVFHKEAAEVQIEISSSVIENATAYANLPWYKRLCMSSSKIKDFIYGEF